MPVPVLSALDPIEPKVAVTVEKEITAPPPKKVSMPSLTSAMALFVGVVGIVAVAVTITLAVLLSQRGPSSPLTPATRTYHIAVEEVAWRYAPSGYDNCSGLSLADSPHAKTFTQPDAALGLIGDTYWRRRYVSYEPDGAFATPRVEDWWPHAGIQGPTVRAGVGETLRVRLYNKGRFPASFHVHGVPLETASRIAKVASPPPSGGSAPASTSTSILDTLLTFISPSATTPTPSAQSGAKVLRAPSDPFSSGARSSVCTGVGCLGLAANSLLVAPGQIMEFSWALGEEVGPEGSGGSIGRLYSELTYDGHVDPGLAGVLVVSPRGASDASRPPPDAAAEVLALFSVSQESASPYLPLNVLDYVWRPRVAAALAAATSPPSTPFQLAAALATAPSSPHVPVPTAITTPGGILAALFNAAAANHASTTTTTTTTSLPITASHPAIAAALGSSANGLMPGQALVFPRVLLGVSLGRVGATLREGTLVGAPSLSLLNASAFAAAHGQVALEGALAPFALAALVAEPTHDPALFEESNTMHGLNGLLYCNKAALPGATLPMAPLGLTTRWYVAVLGTEVDIHGAHWHGNTVLHREGGGAFRSDSISLLPRQIATADMVAHAPGRWLFHCHVTDHIEAGMLGVYQAVVPPGGGSTVRDWLPVTPPTSPLLPLPPPALAAELAGGRLREYFIQAQLGNWSYLRGPVEPAEPESSGGGGGGEGGVQGSNGACGTLDFTALDQRYNGSYSWPKVRFVRYTDATFTTPWVAPTLDEQGRWAHLALLGPMLRGEVGDTLRVWFRNAAPVPFSLHPHGVLYGKGSEGAPYEDGTTGTPRDKGDDMVAPGQTWPYTWFLPTASGPGPNDPSSIPWLYHGHVHEAGDENTGLVGVILVTGRGKARVPGSPLESDLRPLDVDREVVVMAKVFNEGAASREVHEHGHLLPQPALGSHAALDPQAFSSFFTLNGLVACRMSAQATAGERVRLYGVSLGNEIDLHTLGITGHALTFRGKRGEGLSLIPGTMYAADTVAAGGGGWLLGSSVIHHAERGMVARFTVPLPPALAQAPTPTSPAPGRTTREYFVAAAEVEWDYAPLGTDACVSEAFKEAAGDLFPPLGQGERLAGDGTDLQGFPASVRAFVVRGPTAIGRRYTKARYLGFKDAAFLVPLGGNDAAAANSSTGILGPALRATPGDVLRVVLRNTLAFPVNLAFPAAPMLLTSLRQRPVGSSAWGAPLGGSPSQLAALGVPPGWESEALWSVPPSAGPGPADTPTIAWSYSSTLSPDHLYAGLVGGLIVGASPDSLLPGTPAHGAAREYLLAWFIVNENRSPYLPANIARYTGTPEAVDVGEEGFQESNLMHAVSGTLSCNLPGLVAGRGERVRLHLLGLGSELDMHTPQVHGNLLGVGSGPSSPSSHTTAMGVHPGTRATVELVAKTAGQWLLECGVNDHWSAGMRASLTVMDPSEM